MIKIEVSRRDVAWLLRPLQEFPKECQGATAPVLSMKIWQQESSK